MAPKPYNLKIQPSAKSVDNLGSEEFQRRMQKIETFAQSVR